MDNQKITKENIEVEICNMCKNNDPLFQVAMGYSEALKTWIYMKNNSYKFSVKDAKNQIIKIKNLRARLKPLDYKNEMIPMIERVFPPNL